MCGLSGIMSLKTATDRRTLAARAQSMGDALRHRGPDDQGMWIDPDAPIALAHRRLSILDLSPEGHQPMLSASGSHAIVFNGEIYNFAALRADLDSRGATFRGRSDTEVLLACVERDGLDSTLEKIEGMFAIALWDRRARTLTLVRDRLGKKPLYVGWAGGDLVFASELKGLRAHPDFNPAVDRETLAAYLQTGFVCPPRCIYRNVWSLLPGTRLTLTPATLTPSESLSARMEPYWSARRAARQAMDARETFASEDAALDSFDRVFETCVRERMVADVPLGAFLSGGVDSSAVAAMMQRLSPRPVKTYTIGFDENGFDEAARAAAVAAQLGTDHHEARLSGAQALEIVPRMPDMYDEPFADASAIPTALVCAFAHRDVTVALSGDGGDEMFGGYHRHVTGASLHTCTRWIPAPLRQALASAIASRPPSWWDARLTRLPQAGQKIHKAAQAFAFDAPGDIHRALLSTWADPARLLPGVEIPDFEPDLPFSMGFAEEMMLRDTLTYLPADVLVKVDRASMAAGLEARAPFLDRRMFDFAWRVPLSMKIQQGHGKRILRRWLARSLPPALIEGPKRGFTPPIGAWLRSPLRAWAEDLLSETALRDAGLEPAPVRRAWAEHLSGQGDHAARLWVVLMFAAWRARTTGH